MRFAASILCLLLAAPAGAEVVDLRWNPVDKDVQGHAQTISHYLVYYGRSPRPVSVHHPGDGSFRYDRMINAGHSERLHITDLPGGGHWFFAVAAADTEGQLSDYSQELHLAIPMPDGSPLPAAPEPALVPGKVHQTPPQEKSSSCATGGDSGSLAAICLLLLGLWLRRHAAVRPSLHG